MQTLWAPWRHAYITGQHGSDRAKGVPPELAGWPGPDTGCVFCNMLAAVRWAVQQGTSTEDAERAAGILAMRTEVYVCLNAFPYNSGHAMVVPYAHVSSLAGLSQSSATEAMAVTQELERVLRSVYHPDGLNVGVNIGKAAGAGVADHIHMHILPRWAGDTNFMTAVADTRVLPESLESTWTRLRAALPAKATSADVLTSNVK